LYSHFWRIIGTITEQMKYDDAPADAAAYFDRIIGGLCYQEQK
jgi:cytochrome c oxidase assembly protein Cox11